jgi:hypothetical protein
VDDWRSQNVFKSPSSHQWREAFCRSNATSKGATLPKERCEEQSNLAITAVAAINSVCDAKNELDAARKRKLDSEPYLEALCDAQTAEWCAVAALLNHKKEHK